MKRCDENQAKYKIEAHALSQLHISYYRGVGRFGLGGCSGHKGLVYSAGDWVGNQK